MSADKTIPARANLEQYRKQAKELLRDRDQLLPQALDRIRRHHPRLNKLNEAQLRVAAFRLSDAQLVLAREHAFSTWPEFMRHVSSVEPPRSSEHTEGRYSVRIDAEGAFIEAEIAGCKDASAVVLLTQVTGCRGRASTRSMANEMNRSSLCTVVCDLLTEGEAEQDATSETLRYDLGFLSKRIATVTNWIVHEPTLRGLKVGCFSSVTGAAAALRDAAERPSVIGAIVCSGGRPDLAGPWLSRLRAPTLFLAGTRDSPIILSFVGSMMKVLSADVEHSLELLEAASQDFTENPLRDKVTTLACDWFSRHLGRRTR